jgi:transposase
LPFGLRYVILVVGAENMPRKNHRTPKKVRSLDLTIKNPNAAGIDVGSTFHCVAVPPDRDADSVRTFKVYTPDLHELAAWLKECRISTVAMEATGIYWIPVYEVLQAHGFEVITVNPDFVRRMRDPKTDVSDSLLLLQLHTYGQLPASFRPPLDISVLQTYWRQRDRLVGQASDAIRLMQKALDLMNLHLHKAISDISGVTGLRIIRAILGGMHDPGILASMREPGIRCSNEELVHALTGNYRTEHLFALKLALAQYDFAQQQIRECDTVLSEFMATLPDGPDTPAPCDSDPQKELPKKGQSPRRQGNQPTTFDLAKEVERLTGRDWTVVPGIGPMTVMTGIAEVGLDLTKWATERHFSSWLSLCPNRRVTGGRVISSRTRKNKNRFAEALRMSASTLLHSKSALGAELRRLRGHLGPAKAITAMAHKLACLYYRLLRYGTAYVDAGQEAYEAIHRERAIKHLERRARQLGLEVCNPALST